MDMNRLALIKSLAEKQKRKDVKKVKINENRGLQTN
tara:strand:+ start:2795 stop:2902 length:108 start_codon:yes stop_codon:yes gene_type:complete